jgi:hypothetical protein
VHTLVTDLRSASHLSYANGRMKRPIAVLPSVVIAGFIPATHGAKDRCIERVERWVPGINPGMTEIGKTSLDQVK